MKRHVQGWMWVFVILFTVSGRTAFGGASSLAPFTAALIKQYGLEDGDIKNLQFYISADLVLQRRLAQEESTVKGHTLRSFNNERVEEVKLKARTPGVAESVEYHSLEVSFEPNATLEFCTKGNNSTGTYALCAPRWDGNTGYVQYGGREFMALNSNYVYLLVNLKQLAKVEKKSRTVKGRKLPDTE